MFDFATVISPNGYFDWAVAGSDLATDGGLTTAVIISLFTDRLANADDPLPDRTGDRRGWWGDAYLDVCADGKPDFIGSRLWLLSREPQIQRTAQRAKTYCEEALAWMVEDVVAGAVTVPLPTFPSLGFMEIVIIISQQTAQGTIDQRFTALWNMTRGAIASFGLVNG